MRNEQLKSILCEYPPSMRLKIIVEKQLLTEMTVVELLCQLLEQPLEASLIFFGYNDVIIRERIEDLDAPPGAAPVRQWLELDLR